MNPTPSATPIFPAKPLDVAETLAAEALELPLDAAELALAEAEDAAEEMLPLRLEADAAADEEAPEPDAVEETVSLAGQLLGEEGWVEVSEWVRHSV